MYHLLILIALALALSVIGDIVNEIVPVKTPKALTHTLTAGIAMLIAWGLDYSVFTSFGQSVRYDWMNPVFTGVVLVAVGQFVRQLVGGFEISFRGRGGHASA